MKWLIALTPLLIAAQCRTPPQPPSPTPAEGGSPSTGGSSISGGAAPTSPCGQACARLAELGCGTAKPTRAGATCEQVCLNLNVSGTLRLDTQCVVDARSCPEADRCTR